MTEHEDSLSLSQIDSKRDTEEKQRDGKSGEILYTIRFLKNRETTVERGKITEIGLSSNSLPVDLRALDTDTYTHYGIFRMEDRSTTLIVQDQNGKTYKALSLGRDTVKVQYEVNIEL